MDFIFLVLKIIVIGFVLLFILCEALLLISVCKDTSSKKTTGKQPLPKNLSHNTEEDLSKYWETLREYYLKYQNQVFQEKTLIEISKITNKNITEIKHDLKKTREQEKVRDSEVAIKQNIIIKSDKDYKNVLERYYKKYENQVFHKTILREIGNLTGKGITTIKYDLKIIHQEVLRKKQVINKTQETSHVIDNRNESKLNKQPTKPAKINASQIFPVHEFTVDRRNVEHCELTEAIKNWKSQNATSEKLQQQLWILWRFNIDVCVPTVEGYSEPYDWAIIPTDNGSAYVFYTETKLICLGDKPYIIHIPFRKFLDRIYHSNVVNSVIINPTVGNIPTPYTAGFTADILKQICQKDTMLIDGKLIGAKDYTT